MSDSIDLISATIAAFGTLLVYDVFFVTFAQEVEFIWPARWSAFKILFMINRYLPFFDTFLSLHLLTGKNTSRECLIGFKAVTWLIVIGIMFSEGILMLRTYALWERNRVILLMLIILAVGTDLPAIVITQLEANSFVYEASDFGCAKSKPSSPIIFVAFLLLIVSETAIVVLTMIRAWNFHRRTRSALLVRMYKDGLFYYIYLLAFSLVNLLIAVAAPPRFENWLTTPQRVLHSLLCTRVLLHIRSHDTKPDTQITETRASLSFEPVAPQVNDSVDRSTSSVLHSGSHSGEASGSGYTSRIRAGVEVSLQSRVSEHGSKNSYLNTSPDPEIELQDLDINLPELVHNPENQKQKGREQQETCILESDADKKV